MNLKMNSLDELKGNEVKIPQQEEGRSTYVFLFIGISITVT